MGTVTRALAGVVLLAGGLVYFQPDLRGSQDGGHQPAPTSTQSEAPPRQDPPLRLARPLPDFAPEAQAGLSPAQRAAVSAARDFCQRWGSAETRTAQRAMQAEEAAALRRAFAGGAQRWLGIVMEREVSGDRAHLTLHAGGGVFLATAGVGFLSTDPDDTRILRGGSVFATTADAARGDAVTVTADLIEIVPEERRCAIRARIRHLASLGPAR